MPVHVTRRRGGIWYAGGADLTTQSAAELPDGNTPLTRPGTAPIAGTSGTARPAVDAMPRSAKQLIQQPARPCAGPSLPDPSNQTPTKLRQRPLADLARYP